MQLIFCMLEKWPSILVLNHLEKHPEERDMIWEILSKPRFQTTKEEVDFLIKRFDDSGALEASLEEIQRCKEVLYAQDILYAHPKLFSLLESMIALALKPIEKML